MVMYCCGSMGFRVNPVTDACGICNGVNWQGCMTGRTATLGGGIDVLRFVDAEAIAGVFLE